jgi:hypothetical protein
MATENGLRILIPKNRSLSHSTFLDVFNTQKSTLSTAHRGTKPSPNAQAALEETISQRLMNPCRGCMQLGLDLLGLHSVYHVAAPWIIWVSKRGNDGIYFFNHPGSPKCPGNHLLKGSKYAMVHHGPGSSWCQRAKLLSF